MRDAARGWLLYCRARRALSATWLWTAALAVILLVGLLVGPVVFEVRLDPARPPRFVALWELVPGLLASTLPALLSPRMAAWERLAGRRVSVCALATALACLVAPPLLTLAVGRLVLPPDARYLDIAGNVVVLGALGLIAVAVLGRVAGPLLTLALFAAVVALQQAVPDVAGYLPLAYGERTAGAQAGWAAGFGVAGLAVWTCLGGGPALATWGQD